MRRGKFSWASAQALAVVAIIGTAVVPTGGVSSAAETAETPTCKAWTASPGDTITLDQELTVAVAEMTREGDDCATGSVHLSDASATLGNSGMRAANLEIELTGDRLEMSDGVFMVPEQVANTNFEFDPAVNGGVAEAVADTDGGLDFESGSLVPTSREPQTRQEPPAGEDTFDDPVYDSPQDVPGYVGGQDGNGVEGTPGSTSTIPDSTSTTTSQPTTSTTTTTTVGEDGSGSEEATGDAVPLEMELISSVTPAAPSQTPPEITPGDVLPAFLAALLSGQITIGLELQEQGVYVRIGALGQLRVHGLLKWDGSYLLNVELDDLKLDPDLPAVINATGTISGTSVDAEPIIDITGTLTGGLELAPNLEVTEATVHITNGGVTLDANAVLGCQSGQLDVDLDAQYQDEDNWNAALRAGSAAECVIADGLSITGTDLSGSVSSVAGVVSGEVTLTASASTPELPEGLREWDISLDADLIPDAAGEIRLAGEVSLVSPTATFSGQLGPDGSITLTGTAQIQGPAGDVTVSGTIAGSTDSPEVSLTGEFRAGFASEDIKISEVSTGLAMRDLTDDPGVVASHSKTAGANTADRGIDNDPATFEATASNGSYSWFEVDLGTERYVDSLTITPRPGTTGLNGAVVQGYLEQTTSGRYQLDYKTAERTVKLERSVSGEVSFPVRATVRYIRVWGRAARIQPDIAELEIQGANTDAGIPTNWVTDPATTAEGVGLGAAYMPRLADKIVSTGTAYGTWTGGVATMTRLGVDLGVPRYIDVVDIYGIVDNASTTSYPSHKLVLADEPLSTSSTLEELRARADVRVFDLEAGQTQTVDVRETARYVAVVKPEGVRLAMVLGELNVMGGSTPAAAKGNLARAAGTTITSSGAQEGTAERLAADGVTDPLFSRRPGFASSDDASSAYLEFDTGATNFIDSVRLFERQAETPRLADTCTPTGNDPVSSKPYTHCQHFTYTGEPTSFVAPWDADYQLKIWGAGGGPGYSHEVTGGHGGYSTGSVALSGGQSVELGVGEGGRYNSRVTTFGGGGKGKGPYGNSGGGMSWARTGSDYLLIAGGGGAAAGVSNGDGGSGGAEQAFDGGVTTGNRLTAFYADVCSVSAGKGGSQTAGGAQGSPASDSTPGTQYQGGDGAYRRNLGRSGGGGGGFFGGGGGDGATNNNADCAGGAGGGGSSYAAATLSDVSLESRQVRDEIDRGVVVPPPGSDDPHYDLDADVAEGRSNRLAGGNGLVVVQWTDPEPQENSFDDLVVLVSETPFSSSDTETAMTQSGVTTYPISALDASGLLTVGRLGRYVRIASSAPAALDRVELAEAQIWGSAAAVFDGAITVDAGGVALNGTISSVCPGSDGLISFGVSTAGASLDDLTVDVTGNIAGDCKIGGVSIDGASLEGQVNIAGGNVTFEGDILLQVNGQTTRVSITIGDEGIGVTGTSEVACLSGSVTLDLAAALNGTGQASGGTVGVVGPGGCVLTDGIALAEGDSVRGSLTQSPTGELTLELGADIVLQADWLPGDAAEWTATATIVEGPGGFRTNLELTSEAGSFEGVINPDGTFSLDGELEIDVSGSSVEVEAHIVKATPGGQPVVDIGGAFDITQNGVRLAGTLVVSGNNATIDATATIACDPGSIEFAVNGVVPLDGDWALDVSAAVPSGGCRINPDVLLESGQIGGTVGIVGGELTVDLEGEVEFVTTPGLIPGANRFTGTFAIATVGEEVVGSVALVGNGIRVGGTITWTDEMNWTASAGGFVTIKGVRVDFAGRVRMVNGRARYTAGGSIRGPIQLADNVWLLWGSATVTGNGNYGTATFSGAVRVACTSGDLYANASGNIAPNENWSVQFAVNGNGCRFGRNLTLDGNVASGHFTSVNGRVSGTLDAHVTRWEPVGGVVISNINFHLEVTDGFHFRGRLSADARVTITVVIFFVPFQKTLGASVNVNFDVNGRGTGRVGVGIHNVSINGFSLPFRASLELRLRNGTINGLTLGL
ncbi:MAG: glycine-rich protein [Microthrixaceae bacterium]